MRQEDLKKLTDKPFTSDEFDKISYVYHYYPGIVTYADIALIWTISGIRLIDDMLPTARSVEEAEENVDRTKTLYENAQKRLNALLSTRSAKEVERIKWRE